MFRIVCADVARRVLRAIFVSVAILLPLAATASAQSAARPTDSTTPLGLEQGTPAGAFELSGFESVNPYNGNLNFHLPLLHIGGRGDAQTTMMLALNTKSWRVLHTIHNPGSQNPMDVYAPVQDSWWLQDPAYGPGVMEGRHSGYQLLSPSCTPQQTTNPVYKYTVTQLTFRASDGTEYQFRDQLTGGQPATMTNSVICPQIAQSGIGQAGFSRGTVWVSTGGEAMTFVSDTAISDHAVIMGTAADHVFPSGLLMMRDGTQYRIDSGLVSWIRDRNGNSISFGYDQVFKRVISITSSLGTTVTVNYDVNDPLGICDQIVYNGFGHQQRIIRVFKSALENALRSDQGGNTKTPAQLFPPSEGMNGSTSQTNFSTNVVTKVLLPDGLRSYNFFYNVYAELARVILPSGGMIDYEMNAGSGILNQGDCPVAGDITCNPVQIYRRVAKRTVYPSGPNTTAEGSMTFGAAEVGDSQLTYRTTTTITHYAADGQTVLAKDVHIFSGSPTASLFVTSSGNFYPAWGEGKEIQTDSYDPTRGKLESAASLFVQRTPAPTTSWWMPWLTGMPADSSGEPPQDPRLASTTTTLVDSSEVSSTTYQYDQFSNVTDKYEYDFGGALLRHTNTQYVTTANSTNYTDPAVGVHLRNLPSVVKVSDNSGPIAETDYEYDYYTTDTNQNHAPLVPRASMTGVDSTLSHATATRSTSSYITRGNVTAVTRKVLQDGTSRISYAQYDIAGNVVLSIDPNGGKTSFDFTDKFGSPSGSVTDTTTPNELAGGKSTFAFPSSVTNVTFNFTSYAKYDYYTGHAVDAQDINGVDSSASYAEPLDRQTSVTRAANQAATLRSSTVFTYDDANRIITTNSDRDALGDGLLKSQLVYDGMGRTIESRQYESAASYITTMRSYDGMGRTSSVSNPYRTEMAVFTTTLYDGLSRVTKVTTPDNAIVQTDYYGGQVLVTDQAGKQRISKSDGLGRLTDVWEVTAADSATESVTFSGHSGITAGYRPSYTYDGLDDLTQVTQQIGSTTGTKQTRTFLYDSLKELTDATNPESGHVHYTYDSNGNLQTKLDARSIKTQYVYDAMNRLTGRSYKTEPQDTPEGTPSVNFYYDQNLPTGFPSLFTRGSSLGRLVATTYGGTTAGSYTGYDPLGRPNVSYQQTDSQNYGFSYGYNVAGAMISETYPSGKVVQMDYDAAGRLSGVKNQASGLYYAGGAGTDVLNQIQYASHGAISAMKLGNGKWEHTNYNNRLQPLQIGLGTASTDSSLLELDYSYGTTSNNGNVLSQTITIGSTVMSQGYGYDALNRLSSATETFNSAQQWQQNYDYDRFGNRAVRNNSYLPSPRQTPTSSSPSDLSFLYNQANNRITATSDYQYDPAGSGNLTSMPNMFPGADAMAYDAENRQKSYTPAGGGTTNYTYDGDGRRVKKAVPGSPATTTVFVYNVAGQLVAEYTSDPVPPAQGGGGISYLTSDHLGSTRVVTKQDGTVKARYDYLPFGEELGAGVGQRTTVMGYSNADSTRQKFTQKERDGESGLDYFLARYCSSAQGRFTSPDEFAGGPEDLFEFADQASVNPTFYADLHEPQSFNKYQYCYNNPLCYIDPDGHQSLTDRLKQAAKPTADATVEVAKGILKGIGASISFGFFPGTEPSSNDSLLDRAGQAIGTAIANEVSTDVTTGSGLITVLSGALLPK